MNRCTNGNNQKAARPIAGRAAFASFKFPIWELVFYSATAAENPNHTLFITSRNGGNMSIYETVKDNVSLREVAQRYGIDVNRYGKALCPFHNDRNPSLYVADDHYYCFACGEHGDVIDFVGKLFQLSPYDAARKLMADFHLSPDKPPSGAPRKTHSDGSTAAHGKRAAVLFCSVRLRPCAAGLEGAVCAAIA